MTRKEYIDKINSLVEVIEDTEKLAKQPLVSITCSTFNHEKFIAQAIEGFLMQQTNFDFEIIIGDDCSTDNNRQIILDYYEQNKDKIRLRFAKTNLRTLGLKNSQGNYAAARGKYIALCEGDDYWTDPYKLQKQVDFLEANPAYQACAHETKILTNDGLKANKKEKDTFMVQDFFSASHLNTCSILFRNNISFEAQHLKAIVGDMVLFILCAKKGKIHFIHEPMAVYRMTGSGVYSGVEKKQQHLVAIFESLKIAFPEYADEFQKTIHSKKMHNNLYPLNLSALLKGNTPLEALTYQVKHRIKNLITK